MRQKGSKNCGGKQMQLAKKKKISNQREVAIPASKPTPAIQSVEK